AERVGEEQERGVEARALERGGGEDDSEDGPGAGRPQQAGGDPEHDRRPDAVLLPLLLGQARTKRDERAGEAVGDAREDEGDPEQREEDQRSLAADRIGAHRPAATHRGERGDDGEGRGHSGEHRQGRADEAPVGAGEDERKHGQDAGAEDGQDPAEVGEKDQKHGRAFLSQAPLRSSNEYRLKYANGRVPRRTTRKSSASPAARGGNRQMCGLTPCLYALHPTCFRIFSTDARDPESLATSAWMAERAVALSRWAATALSASSR